MSLGEIKQFACDASGLDANHLPCDGRALNRGTYSDLFALIGTIWGAGDGSTTFNIPDLRDKFLRGSGVSRSVGSFQTGQNVAHSHTATIGNNTHTHRTQSGSSYGSVVMKQGQANSSPTYNVDLPLESITHTHTCDISSQGGSELRPANIAVLYCIQVFNEGSSGSGGLTEEQSLQLKIVSDFIKLNCKQNEDLTYDYSTFFKYQSDTGQTLYSSDDLKYFSALLHGALD